MFLITIIEIIYIYYIFFIFKTTYSIHSIPEIILQKYSFHNYNFLKHSINKNQIYENKICDLGRLLFFILVPILILREFTSNKITRIITRNILCFAIVTSLLLNLNACIYLIPVFIIELIFLIYH